MHIVVYYLTTKTAIKTDLQINIPSVSFIRKTFPDLIAGKTLSNFSCTIFLNIIGKWIMLAMILAYC